LTVAVNWQFFRAFGQGRRGSFRLAICVVRAIGSGRNEFGPDVRKFMNFLIIQEVLAANTSNGEDSAWITILVLVILAAGIGVWTSFRKKAAKPNGRQADYFDAQLESGKGLYKINLQKKQEARKKFYHDLLTAPQEPIPVTEISQSNKPAKRKRAAKEKIDSTSGIEIIETVFLINIIEDTGSSDSNEISMRKFAFNELVRRGLLCKVDGPTLRVYALNSKNLYGKTIQCEALKELSLRTNNRETEHAGV